MRARFSEYAVLGYSGAGVVAARHATVTDLEIGERVAYGGEGTGHGFAESIRLGRAPLVTVYDGAPGHDGCGARWGAGASSTMIAEECSIVGQLVKLRATQRVPRQPALQAGYQPAAGGQPASHGMELPHAVRTLGKSI